MATQKQGILLKQSTGLSTSWNKRYCVIQYNLLLIFDKESNAQSRSAPKTTINLSDCTIRLAEGLHRCGFQITLPNYNNKILAFAASDANDLKEWMEAIKDAARPVAPTQREEKKIPGRWDPPVQQKPTYNNNKGGGPGGNVLEQQQVQQPIQQHQVVQQPVQQQQQPIQQAPQYNYAQQISPQPYQPQIIPQQQYPMQQQYGQPQYAPQYTPQYVPNQPQYAPPPQYGQAQPQYGYAQPQPYQPTYNQPPPQQYNQPPLQQQYNYQQQPPQSQQVTPPPSSQPTGRYSDLLNAPAAPKAEPTLFPSVPQEQPQYTPQPQQQQQGSLFPNLRNM